MSEISKINRISKAFEGKKALIAFITGGDPDMETTEKLVLALEEAGVDMVEIGIPFSDPVAEGPVIQAAHRRALEGGCTVDKLFDTAKRLRAKTKTELPLLFMTYANPVYSYGKDSFMAKCEDSGIDGIIVPDLPFEEKDEFEAECDRHGICLISLVAPTSGDRIEMIAREAKGFLYCVSSLGVTGVRDAIDESTLEFVQKAKQYSPVPCAVGFGISTPGQVKAVSAIADGVIVGSAVVDLVAKFGGESPGPVKKFIGELKLK